MVNKKFQPNLPLLLVTIVITAVIVVGVVIVYNTFFQINKQQTLGVQIENHIGYFDEDKSDKPKTSKQSNEKSKEKTYEEFLKSSKGRKKSNENNSGIVKLENIQKKTMTAAQKKIKKRPELNNGEWLPPIKD